MLMTRRRLLLVMSAATAVWLGVAPLAGQTTATVSIRGRTQYLRLYGVRGGTPVVLSSGDGGWIHLAPHVAEVLASRGFFVVGFDSRAYLQSFTDGKNALKPEQEPADFLVLAGFAAQGSTRKPVLIGVSEGAGLSVLAATDAQTRARIAGVIGLGLPDLNELGWRWRDSVIYLTHGVPKEPMFSTAAIIAGMAPAPFAAIHSTKDEFVALSDVQRVLAAAKEPKRLWIVTASDHRFSDNLRDFDRSLIEAVAWIHERAEP
jgi:type IV secretory pathway VirJ component